MLEMHIAPGACLLYGSGAVCFSNMVLEHKFNLEYSSRLLMVQDHKTLMVQDHKNYGPVLYGPGP